MSHFKFNGSSVALSGYKLICSNCKYLYNLLLQGEFQNDVREGYGVYTYSNGDKYTGHWKAQKRNGQGLMFDFKNYF